MTVDPASSQDWKVDPVEGNMRVIRDVWIKSEYVDSWVDGEDMSPKGRGWIFLERVCPVWTSSTLNGSDRQIRAGPKYGLVSAGR